MTHVTASQFQKAFGTMSDKGAMSDKALAEPVTITKQGRDHLVVLSASEYARLKRRDRTVGLSVDLPDDVIELIKRSKMDERHDPLDDLLKDWTP